MDYRDRFSESITLALKQLLLHQLKTIAIWGRAVSPHDHAGREPIIYSVYSLLSVWDLLQTDPVSEGSSSNAKIQREFQHTLLEIHSSLLTGWIPLLHKRQDIPI